MTERTRYKSIGTDRTCFQFPSVSLCFPHSNLYPSSGISKVHLPLLHCTVPLYILLPTSTRFTGKLHILGLGFPLSSLLIIGVYFICSQRTLLTHLFQHFRRWLLYTFGSNVALLPCPLFFRLRFPSTTYVTSAIFRSRFPISSYRHLPCISLPLLSSL